jgi:hypothetical protein
MRDSSLMDFDKSPGSSSAKSTFSLASTVSQRFTQAVESKALDFSLATGLPPSKQKRRQKRLSAVVEMAANLTGMEDMPNLGKDVTKSRDQRGSGDGCRSEWGSGGGCH